MYLNKSSVLLKELLTAPSSDVFSQILLCPKIALFFSSIRGVKGRGWGRP
jgi:hypothetical protein